MAANLKFTKEERDIYRDLVDVRDRIQNMKADDPTGFNQFCRGLAVFVVDSIV